MKREGSKQVLNILNTLEKEINNLKQNIVLNDKYLNSPLTEDISNLLNTKMSEEEEFLFYKKHFFEMHLKFLNYGKWYVEPLYKVSRIYANKETFKNNIKNTEISYKKGDMIFSLNEDNFLSSNFAKTNSNLKKTEFKLFSIFCFDKFLYKYFDYYKNEISKKFKNCGNNYIEIMKIEIMVPELEEQELIAIFLELLETRINLLKYIN